MNDILIILVIYNIRKEDSIAYCTLRELIGEHKLQQCLYIHDNTICNKMLSGAYNDGMLIARQRNKKWIILLDEDTKINQNYIDKIKTLNLSKDIYIPTLKNNKNKVLSPFWYNVSNGPFAPKYKLPRKGRMISAFNSGIIIRREAIETIGGFSKDYPLDYLDYWLFRQAYIRNFSIELLDAELMHGLSVEDYSEVSLTRYLSILSSEHRFATECGKRALCFYRWHLGGRLLKWIFTKHPYVKETFQAFRNL